MEIDVDSHHPAQGLLLAAWIADRLGWGLISSDSVDEGMNARFHRSDGAEVSPGCDRPGQPSVHPGQLVGLRLIAQPDNNVRCASSSPNLDMHAAGERRHG